MRVRRGVRSEERGVRSPQAGLYLEIDPRGGKISIYEKEGGEALCT